MFKRPVWVGRRDLVGVGAACEGAGVGAAVEHELLVAGGLAAEGQGQDVAALQVVEVELHFGGVGERVGDRRDLLEGIGVVGAELELPARLRRDLDQAGHRGRNADGQAGVVAAAAVGGDGEELVLRIGRVGKHVVIAERGAVLAVGAVRGGVVHRRGERFGEGHLRGRAQDGAEEDLEVDVRDAARVPAGIDRRELHLAIAVGELDAPEKGRADVALRAEVTGLVGVAGIIAVFVAMPDVDAGIGDGGAVVADVDQGQGQVEGRARVAFGDVLPEHGAVAAQVERIGPFGLGGNEDAAAGGAEQGFHLDGFEGGAGGFALAPGQHGGGTGQAQGSE